MTSRDNDRIGEFLRQATRESHQALEDRPALRVMRAAGTDLGAWLIGYQVIATGYTQIAQAIRETGGGFWPDYAAEIFGVGEAYRQDLSVIADDGFAVSANVPNSPSFTDADQTLGAIWCLNGSRLGAKLLLNIANRSFGDAATRYLKALQHQKSSPRRVAATGKSILRTLSARTVDRADALAGAQATFAYFTLVADKFGEFGNAR